MRGAAPLVPSISQTRVLNDAERLCTGTRTASSARYFENTERVEVLPCHRAVLYLLFFVRNSWIGSSRKFSSPFIASRPIDPSIAVCYLASSVARHRNLERIEAVQMGVEMFQMRLIHHVTFSQPFMDGYGSWPPRTWQTAVRMGGT